MSLLRPGVIKQHKPCTALFAYTSIIFRNFKRLVKIKDLQLL